MLRRSRAKMVSGKSGNRTPDPSQFLCRSNIHTGFDEVALSEDYTTKPISRFPYCSRNYFYVHIHSLFIYSTGSSESSPPAETKKQCSSCLILLKLIRIKNSKHLIIKNEAVELEMQWRRSRGFILTEH